MLSKNNKILIGCLALLLVMSVGYALFSDTITINGTATAKGEFSITPTCQLVTASNATEADGNAVTVGGTGTCEVNGKNVITTSTLNKPGDMVFYRITLENDGTIPAVLKSILSPNNTEYISAIHGMPTPGDKMYVNEYGMLAAYGSIVEGLFQFWGEEDVSDANIVLQPGERRDIYIIHAWGDSPIIEQPVLPDEGTTMDYNVTLNFEQYSN